VLIASGVVTRAQLEAKSAAKMVATEIDAKDAPRVRWRLVFGMTGGNGRADSRA
jgi:hypothetical protein